MQKLLQGLWSSKSWRDIWVKRLLVSSGVLFDKQTARRWHFAITCWLWAETFYCEWSELLILGKQPGTLLTKYFFCSQTSKRWKVAEFRGEAQVTLAKAFEHLFVTDYEVQTAWSDFELLPLSSIWLHSNGSHSIKSEMQSRAWGVCCEAYQTFTSQLEQISFKIES